MTTAQTTRVAGAALALLLSAACGSDDGGTSGEGAPGAPGASPTAATDLQVADGPLGQVVVDAAGMTAYLFTKDAAGSGQSACTGECLASWPPITTTASAATATGVTAEVGTITLADGRRQVTVAGLPVYRFAKDTKPGDVRGQGVGRLWYVVAPDGEPVTAEVSGGSGY